MKMLFYRLPSSRSFPRLFSVVAFAALTFFVLDEAYAVPPALGGSRIGIRTKGIATNTNLVCDLDDPDSSVEIIAEINPLSFTLRTTLPDGVVICQEFDRVTGDPVPGKPASEFILEQISMSPSNNGLNGLVFRTQSIEDSDDEILIWEFIVNDSAPLNEVLEWRLTAVNPMDPVCEDPDNLGTFFSPCTNRWGVPASPDADTDFPDRDVDGVAGNDFGAAGVVFQYTELRLANGNRFARSVLFGPCHTGSFKFVIDEELGPIDPILCEVTTPAGTFQTTAAANISADGIVDVEIKPETFNYKSNGTFDVRILGDENLSRPPVKTLIVNGVPVMFKPQFADVNDDGIIDFVAKVERKAVANALCASGGDVTVTGTFNPEGTFTGKDTIRVNHCP